MRLLTHNSLRCPAKDVIKGYPLKLQVEETEVIDTVFDREFLIHILPSLDWTGVLVAANAVGLEGMPATLDHNLLNDKEFLQAMHNLLLEVRVKTGKLICPESGRSFPIVNSIPDMMLPEEDV
jgi:multifunctional methyltransferase subunit TRM112